MTIDREGREGWLAGCRRCEQGGREKKKKKKNTKKKMDYKKNEKIKENKRLN